MRLLLQAWERWLFHLIHRDKQSQAKSRKKRMFLIKEQDKTSEKILNEMEVSNLPDREFKEMVIKMLIELGIRMGGHRTLTKK